MVLNFIGIGAQKAGTTWMYHHLSKMPNIVFPAGKEVHFWDIHYGQGVEWYRSQFESIPLDTIAGDITPAYAILPIERIKEVYSAFPELRIVYLLRNPIERAWSSALMALMRAEMTIDEASDQWFIDHFNSKGSKLRGDYQQCLENWLSVYRENNMLILLYDDIVQEPSYIMQKILSHIGRDCDENAINHQALNKKIFSGSGHEIRSSLSEYLQGLYATKVIELKQFLVQLDCFYSYNKDINWM